MAATGERPRRVLIRPPAGLFSFRFREIWDYRELFFFLTWRDVKVRYKQTALGAAWALLQPLLLMAVFSIFLGRLAGVSSEGVPYPVFTLAALVPWTLFAQSLTGASESLVTAAQIVSKVYFPRLIMPLAAAGSFLIDFVIALILLLGVMTYYAVPLTLNIVWVPLLTVLALLASASVGVGFAAVNVKYRDVRYTVPFLIQVWLFATPVAYSIDLVPDQWKSLYAINPMVGVVEGFRWALLGTNDVPAMEIVTALAVTTLLLTLSVLYFQKVERGFADVI